MKKELCLDGPTISAIRSLMQHRPRLAGLARHLAKQRPLSGRIPQPTRSHHSKPHQFWRRLQVELREVLRVRQPLRRVGSSAKVGDNED